MSKMTDVEYEEKLKEMRKYLPFLQRVIEKLKINNEQHLNSPRKGQLHKMEMLQDLLMNKAKKLKMETLLKCEGVLMKMHAKMEKTIFLQNNEESANSSSKNTAMDDNAQSQKTRRNSISQEENMEIADIAGPESPPPPQQVDDIPLPVEIPTERRCSPITVIGQQQQEQQEQYPPPEANNPSLVKQPQGQRERSQQGSRHIQNPHQSHDNLKQIEVVVTQGSFSRPSSLGFGGQTQKPQQEQQQQQQQQQRHKSLTERADRNEVYSPQQSWDELTKQAERPSGSTSNQWRNPDNPAEKSVFSRLGRKVASPRADDVFENLQAKHVSPTKSVPISIPARVTPIPEVLKSPPLSASDISSLLGESGDVNTSISEIGTRRSPKPEALMKTSVPVTNSLEFVRKKFAMITKNASPNHDSPASPPLLTSTATSQVAAPPKERLALKYNPHPRVERISVSSNDEGECGAPNASLPKTNDPRSSVGAKPTHVNVLPSINLSDPRLRRSAPSVFPTTFPPSILPSSLMATPPIVANPVQPPHPAHHHHHHHPPHPHPHPHHRHQMLGVFPSHMSAFAARTDSMAMRTATHPPERSINPGQQHGLGPHSRGQALRGAQYQNKSLFKTKFPPKVPPKRPPQTQHTKLLQKPQPQPQPQLQAQRPPQKATTTAATSNDYSSEENWDSEPESTGPVPKMTSSLSKVAIGQNTFKANHPSALNKPTYCKGAEASAEASGKVVSKVPAAALSTKHPFAGPSLSMAKATKGSLRFNALLNDKSERIKYWESKKQKHTEPRTYGEFRQARARAAAEEAAKRRAAEEAEAAKKAPSKVPNKTPKEDLVASPRDGPVNAEKTCPIAKELSESNLDKMYRTSNFSTKFPKAKTNFKIPKKKAEEPAPETPPEKTNFDQMKEGTEGSTSTLESTNEAPQNVKSKSPRVVAEESHIKLKKKFKKNVGMKKGVEELVKSENAESHSHDPVGDVREEQMRINNKNNNQKEKTDDALDEKKPVGRPQKKLDDSTVEIPDETRTSSEPNTTNKCDKTFLKGEEEMGGDSGEDVKQRVEEIKSSSLDKEKMKEFPDFKPQRIIRRRCTMITYGSAPEVDKEKLLTSNALLFEDLQESEKQKRRAAEGLKMQTRHSRNLEEMFQKTDDNCSVSTQNIISGKRRTRTTVNFNETQQVKAIFHQNKATEKEGRKESAMRTPKSSTKEDHDGTSVPEKNKASSKTTKPTATGGRGKGKTKMGGRRRRAFGGGRKAANKCGATNQVKEENDEHQHCAVSSTSAETSAEAQIALNLDSNTSMSSTTVTTVTTTSEANDNEPSSSAKSTNPTPTLPDEENSRQEILNDFVQEILKPNVDKSYIFNLLSQILNEEKLELVKAIVESAAKENAKEESKLRNDENSQKRGDDADLMDTDEDEAIARLEGSKVGVTKDAPVAGKKLTTTCHRRGNRKSELDRLNDDIRDMFISEGVLTATGKRMCTLVAVAKKATRDQNNVAVLDIDDPNEQAPSKKPTTTTGSKEDQESAAKKRGSKSKSLSSLDHNNDDDAVTDDDDGDDDDVTRTSSGRQMPTLEPNTPIKLREEEGVGEGEEEKVVIPPFIRKRKLEVKLRKCKLEKYLKIEKSPDSSKSSGSGSGGLLVDSDSEDDIELITLKKRLCADVPKTDEKPQDGVEGPEKTRGTLANTSRPKDLVKNTNPSWHNQSKYAKWCVLCNIKLNFVAMHYQMHHSEHYCSRLERTVLEQLKEGSEHCKAQFGVEKSKTLTWFHRCPFCLQHNRTALMGWLEHFKTHTAEYNFECSGCRKGCVKSHVIDSHILKKCHGASVVNNGPLKLSTPHSIVAHVCHLCNFVQLKRSNLERHFVEQHDLAKEQVGSMGYVVTLISVEKVKVLSEKAAAKREAEILANAKGEVVGVSVDDDDAEGGVGNVENEVISSAEKLENSIADSTTTEPEQSSESKAPEVGEQSSPKSSKDGQGMSTEIESKLKSSPQKSSTDLQDELLQLAEQAAKNARQEESSSTSSDNNTSQSKPLESSNVNQRDLSEDAPSCVPPVKTYSKRKSSINQTETQVPTKPLSASNSNVFMPTRESNDSPTVESFAQSLLDFQQEAQSSMETETRTSVKNPLFSIAERLSQRFKGFMERRALNSATNVVPTSSSSSDNVRLPDAEHKIEKASPKSPNGDATNKADKTEKETSSVTVDNVDGESLFGGDIAAAPETTSDDCTQLESNSEDDENWEDIEIMESAPSTCSSIVSSSSMINKNKNRNIFQKFSMLYASMGPSGKAGAGSKVKKPPAPQGTINKKRREKSSSELGHAVKSAATTATSSSGGSNNTATNVRPVLTNIDDLLPNSPCSDPIDLVPELAPLEPLQDLNDISSILETNFSTLEEMGAPNSNSICINTDNQHTTIQDALEFVTEQQTDFTATTTNEVTQSQSQSQSQSQPKVVINRIQNVGYSVGGEGNTFKFYCLAENCTFLFSSEAVGLENHYLIEHSKNKWNGNCNLCHGQVASFTGDCSPKEQSISAEIKHMLEKHANRPLELNIDSTTSSNDSEGRPRIKLRRLTGDCLSSTSTEVPPTQTQAVTISANVLLGALLNAKPRPPTKDMPPQPQMPLTEPILMGMMPLVEPDGGNASEPLYKNVGSDFAITSVTSASSTLQPVTIKSKMPDPSSAPLCPLKIVNVVGANAQEMGKSKAFNESSVGAAPLPRISNVCSLNSQSSPVSTGSFWAHHAMEARPEVLKSPTVEAAAADMSRSLANSGVSSASGLPTNATLRHFDNESPGPVVVAETVPVAQAQNGNFLITQTVSAQYNRNPLSGVPNAQLGFNISIAPANHSAAPSRTNASSSSSAECKQVRNAIRPQLFKCMAGGCKYQTRVPVAMSEHLYFHQRRNFSTVRDYLRCSMCSHLAEDVEDYIQHADQNHFQSVDTATGVGLHNMKSPKDPNSDKEGEKRKYIEQLSETIQEIVGPTGLPDDQVYRCVVKGCMTKLDEPTFQNHIIYHISTLGVGNVNNYVYKCPHCAAVYHRLAGIKAHIRNHARNRYFCYICQETSANSGQILKHFSEKHWHTYHMVTSPLIQAEEATANTSNMDYFVAYTQQLSESEVEEFGKKLILEWQRKKAGLKTHFRSSEIDLLPKQPIFQGEINCAECEYKTKVRSNMLRHLQMHKVTGDGSIGGHQVVASVDPVNPVPCLNSNERFFDKMTNLASSSLVPSHGSNSSTLANSAVGGDGVTKKAPFILHYAYIPDSKRFTCGAIGCQYLTLSDDIFRSHLSALHSNTLVYRCPFCRDDICKRGISNDRIVNHLRFHGPKLYRCEECNYLHYMRSVVERHINEKHATMRVNVIAHDRQAEGDTEGATTSSLYTGRRYKENLSTKATDNSQVPSASDSSTKSLSGSSSHGKSKDKWACDLCPHRTASYQQMITHCQNQHNCSSQYQCVHCSFGAQQLSHILAHIDERHSGKTREARYVCHKLSRNDSKSSSRTDMRPLWQRDDPKRVRHIRGILMEDEEESEQYRKRVCLEVDDDEDEAEDKADVASTSTDCSGYEFGCLHCNYKSNFYQLKTVHWETLHNTTPETALPFFYRLLRRLHCAECRSFSGDYNELQLHQQTVHKTQEFCAAEAGAGDSKLGGGLQCAYCDCVCESREQLVLHHKREAHEPQDVRLAGDAEIMNILKMGTIETYVQCTICADVFANRVAILTHARAQHLGEENFSFRELTNTIIYRCPNCPYTSTNELSTLRHMIDDYEKFRNCHFCHQPQSTFNGYMQHCYAEHRDEIRRFSELYPFPEIKRYLQQIRLLFPNGLVIKKGNLRATKYGKEDHMEQLYEEICKTSQQPPIPRLSIARLVAQKLTGRSAPLDGSSSNGGKSAALTAKRISKRRQTVAVSHNEGCWEILRTDDDKGASLYAPETPRLLDDSNARPVLVESSPKKISKRRCTVALDHDDSPWTLLRDEGSVKRFKTQHDTTLDDISGQSVASSSKAQDRPPPPGGGGDKLETIDFTKVYTKVAIGGSDTSVTLDKFRTLFKIDACVLLDKVDGKDSNDSGDAKKRCEAANQNQNDHNHDNNNTLQ